MFWPWKKSEIETLIARTDDDLKSLQQLELERAALLPKYSGLQESAEELAARISAFGLTRPGPNSRLFNEWEARLASLKSRLEDKLRDREQVLAGINEKIEVARASINRRNSHFCDAFSSWLSRVSTALNDEELRASRKDLRREIDWMRNGPLRPIIEVIVAEVEKIEQLPNFEGPVFKLDLVAKAAANPKQPGAEAAGQK